MIEEKPHDSKRIGSTFLKIQTLLNDELIFSA